MRLLPDRDRQEPGRSKAALHDALRGVQGWLLDDEAWALHEAVRRHPLSGTPLTVVEIGSWQGRSTIALASGLRARGGGLLHAIDPHRDSALHRATGLVDTFDAFVGNVRSAGLSRYVRSIRAPSTAARSKFAARAVHVLFVDGSHSFEDVLRDIDDWTPALADIATVAFHDAFAYSDVHRALERRVLRARSQFRRPRRVDDTLFTDFRRGAAWTLRDRLALARFRMLSCRRARI